MDDKGTISLGQAHVHFLQNITIIMISLDVMEQTCQMLGVRKLMRRTMSIVGIIVIRHLAAITISGALEIQIELIAVQFPALGLACAVPAILYEGAMEWHVMELTSMLVSFIIFSF